MPGRNKNIIQKRCDSEHSLYLSIVSIFRFIRKLKGLSVLLVLFQFLILIYFSILGLQRWLFHSIIQLIHYISLSPCGVSSLMSLLCYVSNCLLRY